MNTDYEQTYNQVLVTLENSLEKLLRNFMGTLHLTDVEAHSTAIQRLCVSGAPNNELTLILLKTIPSAIDNSVILNTLSAAYQRIRTSKTK